MTQSPGSFRPPSSIWPPRSSISVIHRDTSRVFPQATVRRILREDRARDGNEKPRGRYSSPPGPFVCSRVILGAGKSLLSHGAEECRLQSDLLAFQIVPQPGAPTRVMVCHRDQPGVICPRGAGLALAMRRGPATSSTAPSARTTSRNSRCHLGSRSRCRTHDCRLVHHQRRLPFPRHLPQG